MLQSDASLFGIAIGIAHLLLAIAVSAHIVLTKEDVRAAIGWAGLVWLTPVIGSVLYGLFGINRIRRSAGRMRRRRIPLETAERLAAAQGTGAALAIADDVPASLRTLTGLVGIITGLPVTTGNDIEPLVNGDEAYPAMLEAIDCAERSVGFATYIFDRGVVGDRFVEALARAAARGVEVRVLIDDVGARYSRPPIVRELRARGLEVARFLPSVVPLTHPYFNLRNHRKLMIVDGATAFCGGMNVRDGCLLQLGLPSATQDVHFRARGPVVAQLLGAFAFDWQFTTREQLVGDRWWRELVGAGAVAARGIADGPDEDFAALLMTILGAISQAARSIRIVTPYFLPDTALIDALRVAALRGVRVEIVLPEHGNLRPVQWASTAILPQLLSWGCRVYLSRPPFDHTKLLVIDGAWSLLGSANWDPRSLRLNFEYDIECYSTELAARLDELIDAKIATGRPLTLRELQLRPLPIRLRDGVMRLAQPYL